MVGTEQLKPFLLHPNRVVRDKVAQYFQDGWILDPDILPLTLRACQQYGFEDNRTLLMWARHQGVDEASFQILLHQLAQTRHVNTARQLGRLIVRAPLDLLRSNVDQVQACLHLHPNQIDVVDHRLTVADLTDDQAWERLKAYAEQAEEKAKYVNDLNHAYVDALIETLAGRPVPDNDTICRLLQGYDAEHGDWMEVFLVDLAGARRLKAAIPELVRRFRIDADYLLERCNEALARIGDPQAVHPVQEELPKQSWNYQNYAMSVFQHIKHPDTEQAILSLRHTPGIDEELRERLCFFLYELFSTAAMDWGYEILRRPPRQFEFDDIRASLFATAVVNGIDLPEAEEWAEDFERIHRRMEERTRWLDTAPEHREEDKEALPIAIEDLPPAPAMIHDPDDPVTTIRDTATRTGRNDPCPCGSGKKYKRCCGLSD